MDGSLKPPVIIKSKHVQSDEDETDSEEDEGDVDEEGSSTDVEGSSTTATAIFRGSLRRQSKSKS